MCVCARDGARESRHRDFSLTLGRFRFELLLDVVRDEIGFSERRSIAIESGIGPRARLLSGTRGLVVKWYYKRCWA